MDLIRELLFGLEKISSSRVAKIVTTRSPDIAVDGFMADQIDYHLRLISDAGFVDTGPARALEGISFRSLTWKGHDFIDSVRDPEIWSRTKKGAEAAKGFTFDLLADIAKGLIRKQIEEYTGIKL